MTATVVEKRTLVETATPGWFIDPNHPDKKTRKQPVDRIISQEAYEKILDSTPLVVADTGKALVGPTTVIRCVDCGAERTVKVQDKFQVKRCVAHQKDHRNALRRQKRANAKKD